MIYNKYLAFIDRDPRKNRTFPYPVTYEFMQERHKNIFKNVSFENKTVLDLGCCVGYTGAWALNAGAKFYQGVEFSKELCKIAQQNFEESFDNQQWNVINSSVEDFLKSNDTQYDIVIAMGLIYALKEPVTFLENLLQRSNSIVIESSHHREHNIGLDTLENVAFVSYDRQRINYNDTETDAMFYSSRPSITLIQKLLKFNGFSSSDAENELLKEHLPMYYSLGYNKRFVVVGNKIQNKLRSIGYVENILSNTFETRDWQK